MRIQTESLDKITKDNLGEFPGGLEAVTGERVPNLSYSAILCTMFKNPIQWRPGINGTFAIHYDTLENLELILSTFAEDKLKERSRRGCWYFHFETVEELKTFTLETQTATDTILKHCRSEGYLSPPDRRYSIVFVSLSDAVFRELNVNQFLLEQFLNCMMTAQDVRTFIVPLIHGSSVEQTVLMPSCDYVFFLGECEQDAIELFPEKTHGAHHPARVKIGAVFRHNRKTLQPIHFRRRQVSPWMKMAKARRKAEQDVYAEFLRSLPDED